MTLAEIDHALEGLLDAGTPPEAPEWATLLEARADLLARLPATPETLAALECSLLTGARLMAALRAERARNLEELATMRRTHSVHAGYAPEPDGGLREWSA